jgi:hypothetical protein
VSSTADTPLKFFAGLAIGASICLAAAAELLPIGPALSAPAVQIMNNNITEHEVIAAQNGWCQALLEISSTYALSGIAAARRKAEAVIDQAYGYQYGPVAFKPTLASGLQTFRSTREGALAYFIGNDSNFPNDKGFALKPWRSCRVVNEVIQLSGPQAITMGNVYLTDASKKVTMVDKTWSFVKEPDKSIRIVLHHSSLPYDN